MYEKENINAGRVQELQKQNRFLRSENNYIKKNYTRSRESSVKPSAVGRLIAGILVFLVFMSVFQVLTTPGRELPSFKTLKSVFDLTGKVVITNTSFVDEFEGWISSVLNSFDWLINFLDELGLPAQTTITAFTRGLTYLIIPYQFIYFLLSNLWNMVVYGFSLLTWFTSGGIV